MRNYSEFQPTSFDNRGIAIDDQQHWQVIEAVGQNRDSDPLARSNFECAVKQLGGESEAVEVHRFGHWACGWFEIVIVDPSDKKAMDLAGGIELALGNYPVLNEEHWSELEMEEKQEIWHHCYNVKERVELCQQAGVSIFAARHDEMPCDVDEYINLH